MTPKITLLLSLLYPGLVNSILKVAVTFDQNRFDIDELDTPSGRGWLRAQLPDHCRLEVLAIEQIFTTVDLTTP